MELISLILLILCAVLILKLLAFFLQAGIFFITLPLKIFGILVLMLLILFVLIPAGVFGLLAGVLLVPLAILATLIPLLLIGFFVVILLKRS